jgi:hypothetical protein
MFSTTRDKPKEEDVAKQWPGFSVQCDKCGSKLVELDNSMGWSEMSGGWGSIDFVCAECGNRTSIMES